MKLKIFITAFISMLVVSFPANIIGCGPEAEPYDYFISFFSKDVLSGNEYKSFFFTRYSVVYDNQELATPEEQIVKEWVAYCKEKVTYEDAMSFVMGSTAAYVANCKAVLDKKIKRSSVDSVHNSMKDYLLKKKDRQAIDYLLYAKTIEPYVTGGEYNPWDMVRRDSIAMAQLIEEGIQLRKTATTDFFKLKYGYQVVRLAHYSRRYEEAIKWYDEYILPCNTVSILQDLCLSLKAGALHNTMHNDEAAYLFSKTFSATSVKRVSNYYGFSWSAISVQDREASLKLCKSDKERADLLALFALNSTANEMATLKQVYGIDPQNKIMETLVLREVNKIEEKYLTRLLNEKKGRNGYYMWYDETIDTLSGRNWSAALAEFTHQVAADAKVSNPAFYETTAAYAFLMAQDVVNTQECIASARNLHPSDQLKDQLQLTDILLMVNRSKKIDAAFEAEFLPKLQWLQMKTSVENESEISRTDWRSFYRGLMYWIIADRYHQQGELYKEMLAIGNANSFPGDNWQNWSELNFLHTKLESGDVEKLYSLMAAQKKTPFEAYLVKWNVITLKDVIEFAGTAHLREFHFDKAIEWFKKDSSALVKIEKSPFIELLYDQDRAFEPETGTMSKLEFAREMLRLQNLLTTDKANASTYYYKMALGLYNITYYGHSWELVQYYRTGDDGYSIPLDANKAQREYYGCFTAHDYFKKAKELSNDKNFKAKCLFMMAKCAQKQLRMPKYSDPENAAQTIPGYETGDSYNRKFTHSKYFPEFVRDYGNTKFFKEAYNSCSYLRDFIKKKK